MRSRRSSLENHGWFEKHRKRRRRIRYARVHLSDIEWSVKMRMWSATTANICIRPLIQYDVDLLLICSFVGLASSFPALLRNTVPGLRRDAVHIRGDNLATAR